MGQAEIEFQIYPKRDWRGRLRYDFRIVDKLNHKILAFTRQGYSRRIDAMKAIGLIQRYAGIAEVKEVAR